MGASGVNVVMGSGLLEVKPLAVHHFVLTMVDMEAVTMFL